MAVELVEHYWRILGRVTDAVVEDVWPVIVEGQLIEHSSDPIWQENRCNIMVILCDIRTNGIFR